MAADRFRDFNQLIEPYPLAARPGTAHPRLLALLAALAFLGLLAAFLPARPVVLSRWAGPPIAATAIPEARPDAIVDQAAPVIDALEHYNQGSALQDSAAEGRVRFYRRDLPGGGSLAYFVIALDPLVRLRVINADGATPGSDASGDTIWTDGQRHLASVAEMSAAPYARRDGMELLGAIAFGFHGDVRTSDEGTVVIDGKILRINPGRAALCITHDRQARIGTFDARALRDCEQAAGAGPVILWQGKIANPAVAAATSEFLPFNPLREDFVQIDWRRAVYTGRAPKTAVGIGARGGGTFLIMMVAYGVTGPDMAGQLKTMGCTDALGGDDDTSTQAVWRGAPIRPGAVQEVPDALAVYVRQGAAIPPGP